MIRIASVQIGKVTCEGSSQPWTTAFYKHPVDDSVKVTVLGIVGDEVADTKNHGGIDKAVLCYPAEHYTEWSKHYPQMANQFGGFGENLTIEGADEESVCLGDRYQIGSVELEVSQPRQPCWKISRRWELKTLLKEVTQTGRTGWYLRVAREGTLRANDEVVLIKRPYPEWSIRRANDLLFGRESNHSATIELMSIPTLAVAWKESIA